MEFIVQVAEEQHQSYAQEICRHMEESARARGTGIAKRDPEYVKLKIREGKAIIALTDEGHFAGFCYVETWSHGNYVANSGLIVNPEFRKGGLAKRIKAAAFDLSRKKFPDAKIFGITTSLPVMKINSELGYQPVTFSELTDDDQFWKGCQSCVNYDILMSKNRKNCLCTAMLYDPKWEEEKKKENKAPEAEIQAAQTVEVAPVAAPVAKPFSRKEKLYERWMRIKANIMLRENDAPKPQENSNTKKEEKEKVLA